ncbi:hypothetical protein JCM10212_002681 [Sporobolomyces blumeae]
MLARLRPVRLITQQRAFFRRSVSTARLVESTASRSLALPLCFVSVRGWDTPHLVGWQDWIDRFAAKGYSSLLLDVDPSDAVQRAKSTSELLSVLEQELASLLRDPATSSPFPPLLFASSASTLLAETYVSSHPLSGLVLDEPVVATTARTSLPEIFKTDPAEFNYEPGFPIAVIERERDGAARRHRLIEEFGGDDDDDLVRRLVAHRDEGGFERVMAWMDENSL